ncbi:MAG TPA: transposase, partial [Microlunatus sp.]|nr:transposase [Microlunatus sp.]
MDSLQYNDAGVEPVTRLCRFRNEFYSCLGARADAQFELTDALLCADGPVRTLVDLSLVPEHRRGHGALYGGLNHGKIEIARLRRAVAGLPLPRVADRIVLAADVSPWLRPDAETSPDRLFCHVHGRAKGSAQMIPGWPYSIVAALGSGRSSWTAVLDAVRLGPDDDAAAVTAGQLRDVVTRLIAAGHWRPGDPQIEIVTDTGYDVTRLAFVLADLPVILTGRLRSDRVMLRPAPPRRSGSAGRPPRHGPVLDLDQPATWPDPDQATTTPTTRYGLATASAWHRMHPRLARRGAWLDHPEDEDLPIIEGTLVRLQVEHLPGDRAPKPVWLWTSRPDTTAEQVDQAWQA